MIAALIARIAPGQARLVGTLRQRLRKRLPTAHEMVYEYRDAVVISYSPTGRGHEAVLSIRAAEAGVRLYFGYGKDLPDPAGLLQGKANQTRWISLERASDLAKPEIARLIDEAIIRNRIPFAPSGRGPLVIRPTTASRR